MTDINSIIEMIEKIKLESEKNWILSDYYRIACDDIIEQLRKMSEWTKCTDSLPTYSEPVLLKINGVIQNITYMLDGADDMPDWFEPYFFDHDDELKIWWNLVDEWMPIQK